ncbi:MAG TPA: NAD(P)/FAD-dependent oxidoreductase [Blastocatellia bacterium]|nr:NAD(P)/FAD-dependent oxidoreductase [Blastocatellia bacterium]
MQSNEQEVIVIGGGVAGLAAATFIARQGRTVRVFEQSHALGGRARTKEQDGFYFNIGPHALYRGGRGIEILAELGVEPRGAVPLVSGAYAVRDGAKHTFPTGFVSLLSTSLFGLAAKFEMARLLASLPKIDASPLMNRTVSEWLDEQIKEQEVKDFLLALFRVATYTNAPDLMSAGAALQQLKLAYTKNVLYIDGGWQTIVDGLAQAASKAGVIVETGAKVERVERNEKGAVRAVRLADGRSIDASVVVIASSPQVAAALVDRSENTSLAQWASEAVPVRAACLDVALKRLPKPKATFALGVDRPLYLSVHSAAARLAPAGGALIHVAKYLPPDHKDAPDSVERELEGLLDLIQPAWRDEVVYRRFLPDMTVMSAVATAKRGGTKGRPGPMVEEVAGLFIAGDWVGPEGLLVDASLASAKRVAELIARCEPANVAVAV